MKKRERKRGQCDSAERADFSLPTGTSSGCHPPKTSSILYVFVEKNARSFKAHFLFAHTGLPRVIGSMLSLIWRRRDTICTIFSSRTRRAVLGRGPRGHMVLPMSATSGRVDTAPLSISTIHSAGRREEPLNFGGQFVSNTFAMDRDFPNPSPGTINGAGHGCGVEWSGRRSGVDARV